MLCSRILVAYDGSDLGKKALDKAIELAKTNPLIEIEVLHVVTYPTMPSDVIMKEQNFRELALKNGKEIIDHLKEILASIPNKTLTYVKEGLPAEEIIEHARIYSCDMIVMGSRGLSGIKELFLGSVSHSVTQHSPVPVLVVK